MDLIHNHSGDSFLNGSSFVLLKKKQWMSIFLSVVFFSCTLYSQVHLSLLDTSDDTLFLSIVFPGPSLFKSSTDTEDKQSQYVVPLFFENIFIFSETQSIDIEIMEKKLATIKEQMAITPVEDIALDDKDFNYVQPFDTSNEVLNKRYLGPVLGKHLFQVGIYPYAIGKTKTDFEWMEKMMLRIIGQGVEVILSDTVRSAVLSSLTQSSFEKQNKENSSSTFQSVQDLQNNPSPRLKILVDQEGLVSIPQLLITEKGWDVRGIDPRNLRIIGQSGEIPIRIIGEEDGLFDFTDVIEFYGEPLWDTKSPDGKRLDVFSTYNVYWLELGDKRGLRIGQEEGWPQNNEFQTTIYPSSYPFTEHIEQDSYFHRLPYATDVDDADHWFMASPIGNGEKREFHFILLSPDNYATQLVNMRVKLRGQSRDLQIHPVEIYINDKRVAEGNWQGDQAILLESEDFSPMYLKEEDNIFTVVNGSQGEFSELILDWFEITYPRAYQAHDDYIRFCAPPYSEGKMCRFQIEGFTQPSVEIYKKGVSHFIGCEIESVVDSIGPTTYSVTFQDEVIDEETEYVALVPLRKIVPDSVVLVENPPTPLQENVADYIIITPADSLGDESLKDLIQLREEQGLKVKVFHLGDLYDVFNKGIPNPEGIRKFLKYAYQNWSPPPKYVLLVGDGVINNRLPIERGNLIPVVLYQTTKYGASPSDHWYTLLEGNDEKPELAIGRIPVRKREALEAVVNKIVEYEKSLLEPWHNRYLLIGAGRKEDIFGSQSEFIIQNILAPSFHPERLYLSGSLSDPYVGGTEDLLRYFREGVALVNFRGHGGGAIWSDAGLLDLDDVELIENKGKLPIVTSMTCFTGDFTGGGESLGEALVCQKETGAVALWGATGVGWTWNDYYLLAEFCRILNGDPSLTLGEMVKRAKAAFITIYGIGDLPLSEVNQYTLLGDPALRLAFPNHQMDFVLSQYALTQQDTINVEGTGESPNYQLLVELTGADWSTQETKNFQFQQNKWSIEFPVPTGFDDPYGGIRTYLWDVQNNYQAHGFIPFSIGETFFDSLNTIPESPTRQDSVRFSGFVQNPAGLHQVYCQIDAPFQDSLIMVAQNESDRYRTIQSAGPFPPGSVISYHIVAEDGNGIVSVSEDGIIQIPSLSDLVVQNVSLGGSEMVMLEAKIRNLGEENVLSARVRFECQPVSFTAEDTVTLGSYGETIASVPFPSLMGNMQIIATVDPDSFIEEKNKGNNRFQGELEMDRFNVTPESGTLLGIGQSDTVGLVNRISCFIPPGALTMHSVILFEEGIQTEYIPIGNDPNHMIYHISLVESSDQSALLKEATITFCLDQNDSIRSTLKPYQWNAFIRRWIACSYHYSGSDMIVHSTTLGLFQLQNTEDENPPWIEIQVEDQPFSNGSYISRYPHFSAIIQDESGVDIRSEKIEVYLDDILQTTSAITLPDSSPDPKSVTVSFRPDLQPGNHHISVCASDVHGNRRQTEAISFVVSSVFEIQYLGNYPNPFDKETTFAYLLTDEAIKVTLKIYTVSGKLVRSFEDYALTSADYHEIVWDGRDEWGEEVANGVYFFHLKADHVRGEQEIKDKIAKIPKKGNLISKD